jgi:hypothetical protein
MAFSHKFVDRTLPVEAASDEHGPVFLQFLDCVWQVRNIITNTLIGSKMAIVLRGYHVTLFQLTFWTNEIARNFA